MSDLKFFINQKIAQKLKEIGQWSDETMVESKNIHTKGVKMKKVIAKGFGLGSDYNTYNATVEFYVDDYAENDEIKSKAIFRLKDKTACNFVTVKSIEVVTELV